MNIGLSIGLGSQRRSAFDPASLFADGRQGVLFDINPTTAGVAVGNVVASLSDTSGRGNTATAAGALRPTLQTEGGRFYLDFAGAQGMATPSINMSTSDEITVVAGIRKTSDATTFPVVCETGDGSGANNGTLVLCSTGATPATPTLYAASKGTVVSSVNPSNAAYAAPFLCVTTVTAKISTDVLEQRINGVSAATSATDQGTGNFGNYPLNIGSRNSVALFFTGRIYGLIVINRLLTAGEIAQAEAWMATKTGVTL